MSTQDTSKRERIDEDAKAPTIFYVDVVHATSDCAPKLLRRSHSKLSFSVLS